MSDTDFFKQDFKFYKSKNPQPSYLDHVIDFDSVEKCNQIHKVNNPLKITANGNTCLLCEELGLKNHQTWELFSIDGLDGFIYLKNIFTVKGQQSWVRKCLEVYSEKPSVTNLDLHYKDVHNIWNNRNNSDPEKQNYLQKLYWATLGFHHNWDTKVYDKNHCSEFPPCLNKLSKHIAHCIGFEHYKPEAAIVNYYHMKSSLSIHNDHSEEDTVSPIISLSFGQTGLFLLGTENRYDKPTAMFLKSGDVTAMFGSRRLAYHAVPTILASNVADRYSDCSSAESWQPFNDYLSKSRINVNVRQVYLSKS